MRQNCYFTLLGDIIGSSTQSGVQKKLHDAVVLINNERDHSWVAPFEITRGDEIAAVFTAQSNWFFTLRRFIDLIWPFKIRCVMVFDEIREGLAYSSSAEAVGPAFIKADSCMHRLKAEHIFFAMETGNITKDQSLAGVINLYLSELYGLSDLQHQILRLYQKLGNQKETADRLKKTQQQIQKSLKDIKWEIIDSAERAIDTLVMENNTTLHKKTEKKQ